MSYDTSRSNTTTSAYPHSQAWAPPSASSQPATKQPTPGQLAALRDYLSPGGAPAPVPSKEQVHDYLVAQTKRPEGLNSPLFAVHGHRFDVYMLFKLVVQLGGSSSVGVQTLPAKTSLTPRSPETSSGPSSRRD